MTLDSQNSQITPNLESPDSSLVKPIGLNVSRRQFIVMGTGAAASLLLPGCANPDNGSDIPLGPGPVVGEEPICSTLDLCSNSNGFPQLICESLGTEDMPVNLTLTPLYQDNDASTDVVVGRYYKTDGSEPFPTPTEEPQSGVSVYPPGTQLIQSGPIFRFRASDSTQNTLYLNYINALPPNPEVADEFDGLAVPPRPATDEVIDRAKDLNTTNMHFHGFHVSPNSLGGVDNTVTLCGEAPNSSKNVSSDDVLYALNPGNGPDAPSDHAYCVKLPTFHAPGTHWFHAHNHGSTAIQIVDGVAGVLIVEDEGDAVIEVDQDLVWLLQEITGTNVVYGTAVDAEGNFPVDGENPTGEGVQTFPTDQLVYNCANGPSGGAFTVNGVYQPEFSMLTGDLNRWRFVNGTATPRGFIKIELRKVDPANDPFDPTPEANDPPGPVNPKVEMNQIAIDGISFYEKSPRVLTEFNLSPANRTDFLVQLSEAGTYQVVKAQVPINGNYPNGGGPPQSLAGPQSPQVLAVINVTERDPDCETKEIPNPIPGHFPAYLALIENDQLLLNLDNVENIDGNLWYSRPVVLNIFDENKTYGCGNYSNKPQFPIPDSDETEKIFKQSMPVPRLYEVNGIDYTGMNETVEHPGKYYTPVDPDSDTTYVTNWNTFVQYQPGTVSEEERQETVQIVKLNTCEEWIIYNYTNLIHPFHIHVNPFQIVEIYEPNLDPEPQIIAEADRVWWDTYGIPAAKFKVTVDDSDPDNVTSDLDLDANGNPQIQPGYIKIRSRFWDYWGEYVFHCHILIHEDLGMMQNVYVKAVDGEPGFENVPCVPVTTSPDPSTSIGKSVDDDPAIYPDKQQTFDATYAGEDVYYPSDVFPRNININQAGITCQAPPVVVEPLPIEPASEDAQPQSSRVLRTGG